MKKRIQVEKHISKDTPLPQASSAPQGPSGNTPGQSGQNSQTGRGAESTARPQAAGFGRPLLDSAISKAIALLEIQEILLLANSECSHGAIMTDPLPLSERASVGLHELVLEAIEELDGAFCSSQVEGGAK